MHLENYFDMDVSDCDLLLLLLLLLHDCDKILAIFLFLA